MIALWILLNSGSENGLVPDGTKPFSGPMLMFIISGILRKCFQYM